MALKTRVTFDMNMVTVCVHESNQLLVASDEYFSLKMHSRISRLPPHVASLMHPVARTLTFTCCDVTK